MNYYWVHGFLPKHAEIGQKFTIIPVNYQNMKFKVCCPPKAAG
jgi:hypothetical protein